jgi:hypothetical protein
MFLDILYIFKNKSHGTVNTTGVRKLVTVHTLALFLLLSYHFVKSFLRSYYDDK